MNNDTGGRYGPVYLVVVALLGGAAAAQVSRAPVGTGATQPAVPPPAAAAPGSRPTHPDGHAFAYITDVLGATCDEPASATAGAQSDDAAVACARTALARRQVVLSQFVIATVPDYVDSNSAWTFDPVLDALQRAAAAAGYVLHRFYLPDWKSDDQSDPASGSLHEVQPGVVLFRRADAEDGRTDLLAVFIATETPTLGLHEAPFVAAARFIEAWSEGEYDLRVLGPGFSGSSQSLRRAIVTFLETLSTPRKVRSVQVLSGRATSRGNAKVLTFSWPPSGSGTVSAGQDTNAIQVRFSATVRADDVMLHALHDHLVRINSGWEDGAGVALLVESNTAYGQAAGALGSSDPFPKALRIPFPMHISRLRAAAERSRTSQPSVRGSAQVALGLSNSGPTTDVLPSMSPESTAASVETLVEQILETVRREEYGAIGILSTDKRDHLFLAERIVREVPNALLFTTEADLIYTHPDYKAFVRGAIVASTYPLFNATQTLTTPHLATAGRQQFPTMGAHGTYNALLKLLGRDDLLLDYLSPGCISPAKGRLVLTESAACKVPPVWIEVIGQNGLWPFDSHGDDGEAAKLEAASPYTAPIDGARLTQALTNAPTDEVENADAHLGESPAGHALLHVSPWMTFAFFLILLSLFALGTAYLAEVGSWKKRATPWWAALTREDRRIHWPRVGKATRYVAGLRLLQVDVEGVQVGDVGARCLRQEHRFFLLIGFTVMWFVAVWAMRLFVIWSDQPVRVAGPGVALHDPAPSAAWWVMYMGLLLIVLVESITTMIHRRRAAPNGWMPGAIVTVVALYITGRTGWSLGGFIGLPSWSEPESAKLLFARTANPGNWVSPAAPVLAIASALFWWSIWNVRHLLMGGWRLRADSGLLQLVSGGEDQLATQLADTFASLWRSQTWWTIVIPFGLLASYSIYLPYWYTPDGQHFDRFLWWGSLLVLFLVAHSLSQTVHLWLLLRRSLRHLFSHPIGEAVSDISKQPLNWRLTLTPPLIMDLEPMARKARALRLGLQRMMTEPAEAHESTVEAASCYASPDLPLPLTSDDETGTVAAAATLGVDREEAGEVIRELADDLPDLLDHESSHNSLRLYFESDSWRRLMSLSSALLPVLEQGFWRRGRGTGQGVVDAWYRDAEILVGMQAAFVLRDLVARLVSGMTMTMGGAVLALCGHLFYSFPGRPAMLAFDWIVLALAAGAAGAMLISLEKDAVLSGLWSTTPGRLNWTGGFVYRLAMYGLVPVVTLLVWQFPELSGTLFFWIEPLQKAIP